MGEITGSMKSARVPDYDENIRHNAELLDRVYDADHNSAEEIRQSIERTRTEMDETLAMLRNRLDFGELATDAFEFTKQKWSEKQPDVMGTIKRNPGPIALLASGLSWMIYRGSSHDGYGEQRVKERFSETGERIGEKARDMAGTVGEKARGVAESVGEKARGIVGSAKESVGSVRHRASERMQHGKEAAKDRLSHTGERITSGTRHTAYRVRESVSDGLQTNPLAVGAIALAVGAACGMSIPLTSKEEEIIGQTGGQSSQDFGMMSGSTGQLDESSSEYRGTDEEYGGEFI